MGWVNICSKLKSHLHGMHNKKSCQCSRLRIFYTYKRDPGKQDGAENLGDYFGENAKGDFNLNIVDYLITQHPDTFPCAMGYNYCPVDVPGQRGQRIALHPNGDIWLLNRD